MDTRTANRGYFPKPQMCKRPMYDSIDRNVTIALQRMNSPRTAQVVSLDGSGLEATKYGHAAFLWIHLDGLVLFEIRR